VVDCVGVRYTGPPRNVIRRYGSSKSGYLLDGAHSRLYSSKVSLLRSCHLGNSPGPKGRGFVGFILDSPLTLIWLSGDGSERVKLSTLQLERAVVDLSQKGVLPLRQWQMSPKPIWTCFGQLDVLLEDVTFVP
jgi:hypothetical protein